MNARDFKSLTHAGYGEPLQWWHYTDSFATALFITRKSRRIKVAAVHNGHACYWHTPPGNLPLYGLAFLHARPDAPVLVVQSEEAADATRALFADHVCMTWAGGPSAVNQADTAPLAGRDVVLWRDNDPQSETAMARFAVRLRGLVRSVTIIDVPRTWPQKWHLARDLPPEVTVAMLRRMLVAAASPEPSPHDTATSSTGDEEDSASGCTPGASHSVARHAMFEAETRDGVVRSQRVKAALEFSEPAHHERAASSAGNGVDRSSYDTSVACDEARERGQPGLSLPKRPVRIDAPAPTVERSPPADAAGECGRDVHAPIEPPAFPVDVLPPLWGDWCRRAARTAGAPIDYVAMSLLTAAASLIGGARRVSPVPAWREPCVLWTALVGTPSSGKSRGMQAALGLVRQLQLDLGTTGENAYRRHAAAREVARVHARLWRQDVRNLVIAGADPDPLPDDAIEPPLPRRLLTDDPRPRSLADAVRGNPHGLLLAPGDLDGWLARTARATGADQRLWKNAWSAVPWTITRAHQPPADIPSAVSILGALQASLPPARGGSNDSVLARCLFVSPARTPIQPLSTTAENPSPEALAALARLRDLRSAPYDVPLADDALSAFEAFRHALDEQAQDLDGRAAAWWRKGPSLVLRVAGVLTFLAWSAEAAGAPEPACVSRGAVGAATGLWQDYLWPHARVVFGSAGTLHQRRIERVMEWLAARRLAEVSREQIRREALSQDVDAKGADAIIVALVQEGVLQPIDQPRTGPGRPPLRWRVNWEARPEAKPKDAPIRRFDAKRRDVGGRRGADVVSEADAPRVVPLRPSATVPMALGEVRAISATDSESEIQPPCRSKRSEGSPAQGAEDAIRRRSLTAFEMTPGPGPGRKVPAISATTCESGSGSEPGLHVLRLTPARGRPHDPAAPVFIAAETPFMPVINRIADFHDEMTAWRHDIHMHPETAFEEVRTADIVAKKLESFGIEVHRGLAKTGVVGVLRAGSGTRAIGLRADMDALDVHETNTFAHASTHHGKMHACGHDGHTCMLLGAAKHLAETRNFDGTVYFIFQPAEENEGGGRVMVEEGLFDKFPCSDVYGMHNIPGIPVGKFAIRSGPMMAAYDVFEVLIEGKGAHGAMPHHGIDPVVVASHVVTALQSIVARNVDPMDTAVVSTTQIHSGDTWNVIPQSAMLRGTVRTFKAHVQDFIEKRIQEIARNVAAAFGASISFRYERRYPATVNTEAETENAARAAAALVGDANINRNPTPAMGSEDFAWMLKAKPGAYIWIGNGDGEGSCMVHNPGYDFNDAVLPLGASYWVTLVEQQLVRQPVRQAAE